MMQPRQCMYEKVPSLKSRLHDKWTGLSFILVANKLLIIALRQQCSSGLRNHAGSLSVSVSDTTIVHVKIAWQVHKAKLHSGCKQAADHRFAAALQLRLEDS